MAFLTGYRVLDLTDERGLLAGRMLADLGADVVQVEPPAGSSARARVPRVPGHASSYLWEAYAAGKRGIAADLDSAGGQRVIRQLALVADVLIESSGPAVQQPRQLDYDDLRAVNPRLVYVSITPFGRTGPKAGYRACDLTVWAAGGPLDPHREKGRPPVRISLPQAFLHASADAVAGAQLALLAREQTGAGQLVDVSAQASLGITTLGRVLADVVGDPSAADGGQADGTRRIDQTGSGTSTDPASKKWPCKDGLIEFHIGVGPAAGRFTNQFLRWMIAEDAPVQRFAGLDFGELPQLMEAGAFTDADMLELRAAVAGFFAVKTKAEVLAAAVRYKLMCVPVYDTGDLVASEHLAARDYWATVGKGGKRYRIPGRLAHVNADAFAETRPAPATGEHTAEVLSDWRAQLPAAPQAAGPAAPLRPGAGTLPLTGLKVLDLTWVVAGPSIGRTLADFGATVVRVESGTRIDTARVAPPFVGGQPGAENSALYGTWNAGKLGVTLDLSLEPGRVVARDLAAWADVVLESFSPGQVARWGLDYASLSAGRRDLIMLSTAIVGQTGPLAKLAGFGNTGAALSGFQTVAGWPDSVPLGPFGPYTDYIAPRFALAVLLGAVSRRRVTGLGCYIDLSQVEAGAWFQAPETADNADNAAIAVRRGNADREFAPHGVFPAAADPSRPGRQRYVAVAATTDAEWLALARAIGRPDLLTPQFSSAAGRLAQAEQLEAAVAAWTATRTAETAERELQSCGVPAHVSADSADFCADPQLRHRGYLIQVPHPQHGVTTVEGPRYLLSDTPAVVATAAPTLGQHNQQVLRDLLGYGQERIAALTQAGVLR